MDCKILLFTFFIDNTIRESNHTEVLLEVNIVHLYCKNLICSESQLMQYQKILSPEELVRAKKFLRVSDQQKFVAQKALMREILSRYVQKNPAEIIVEIGEHGKPFLKSHSLRFNVSHSGDYFLMGVTRDIEIGVDIERARENKDYLALAKRFFTPAELDAIKNKDDFYRTWTCKEAFIKATGLGLSFGLSNFEIDLSAEKSVLKSIQRDDKTAKQWIVKSLALDIENYFLAIAIAFTGANIEIINI